MKRNLIALLFVATTAAFGGDTPAEPAPAAKEEIFKELASAPKDNKKRELAVVGLFKQAGAGDAEILRQDVEGSDADNVIVVKKGETSSFFVVGGHLDKVSAGDGIIDDWSGTNLVTNIYQALRNVKTRHTIRFVAFSGEETGLKGSKTYVANLSADEKKECKAMLNLECVGVGGPFIWTNGSTDSLEKLLHESAEKEKIELKDHVIQGVSADSVPFENASIPNITIDGLPVNQISLIHSRNDNIAKIDKERYYNTYRLAVRFILDIDAKLEAQSR